MTSTALFAPPRKLRAPARIAVCGPTGSGLTQTALELAHACDGPVGVVDTERAKAARFAGIYDFAHLPLASFGPERLTRAVLAAALTGMKVLVVDTWSQFWSGPDGLLARVDRAPRGEGWRSVRPAERVMLNALLNFPGVVIVTVRSDVENVPERTETGRYVVRRVGGKHQQRGGLEADFDLVLDMDDADAMVGKSNCPALPAGQVFPRLDAMAAETIVGLLDAWLAAGAEGDLPNPFEVAAWGWSPERTVAELDNKLAELRLTGQLDAVVPCPWGDDTDEFTTLEALLVEVRRRAEKVAARPVPVPA